MNDLSNTPAPSGHNKPPVYDPEVFKGFEDRVSEFSDAAGEWKRRGAIEDETTAEKANDLIQGASKLAKEIEAMREKEKKPHLDAGRKIDGDFKGLIKLVDTAKDWLKKPLQAYLDEQDRLKEDRRVEEAKRAEEAAKLAEIEAEEAEERGDLMRMADAEKQAEDAQKQAQEAQKPQKTKVGSATGGGRSVSVRNVRKAELKNLNTAMLHFRDHPEMSELLLRLANAEVRASKGADIEIPGFTIKTERKL